MSDTETHSLDTRAALDVVRKLQDEARQRIKELHQSRDTLHQRRHTFVRERALGHTDPDKANREIADAEDELRRIDGDVRLEEESLVALGEETERLRGVRRAEQRAARRAQIAKLAETREAALDQLEAATAKLCEAYLSYRSATNALLAGFPEATRDINSFETTLRAAFIERTSDFHKMPNSVHDFGPQYEGQPLSQVGGSEDAILARFDVMNAG